MKKVILRDLFGSEPTEFKSLTLVAKSLNIKVHILKKAIRKGNAFQGKLIEIKK